MENNETRLIIKNKTLEMLDKITKAADDGTPGKGGIAMYLLGGYTVMDYLGIITHEEYESLTADSAKKFLK